MIWTKKKSKGIVAVGEKTLASGEKVTYNIIKSKGGAHYQLTFEESTNALCSRPTIEECKVFAQSFLT